MTKPRWVTAATLVLTSFGFGCPFLCVARGSRVRTPRGARAIEDLALGDDVVAVDPATGETVAARLMGVRRSTRETIELSGDGFSLHCTTDHPLWELHMPAAHVSFHDQSAPLPARAPRPVQHHRPALVHLRRVDSGGA